MACTTTTSKALQAATEAPIAAASTAAPFARKPGRAPLFKVSGERGLYTTLRNLHVGSPSAHEQMLALCARHRLTRRQIRGLTCEHVSQLARRSSPCTVEPRRRRQAKIHNIQSGHQQLRSHDVLDKIKDEHDQTFTFRRSCRYEQHKQVSPLFASLHHQH